MPFYMKEVCSYANRSIPGRISPLRCAGCPRHDRHFMLHSRGHLFRRQGHRLARSCRAQHRHPGLQSDERSRTDGRRGRRDTLFALPRAGRCRRGRPYIHAHPAPRSVHRAAVRAHGDVRRRSPVEAARRERRNARYDGRLSAAAAVLRALFRDEQYHDRLRPQRRRTRPRDGRHDRRKPVQHRVRLGIHLSVRSRHVRRGARDRRIAARQPARALRPPAPAVARLSSAP